MFDEPLVRTEGKRVRRAPTLPDGYIPSNAIATAVVSHFQYNVDSPVHENPEPNSPIRLREPHKVAANHLGLSRIYPDKPSHDPDDPANETNETSAAKRPLASLRSLCTSVYAPFKNISTFLMASWFNTGSNSKSDKESDRLMDEVLFHEAFVLEELRGYKKTRANALLDAYGGDGDDDSDLANGWKKETVKIRVPEEGVRYKREDHCPEIEIEGLYYRSLVDTIQDGLSQPNTRFLHHVPFVENWQATDESPPQRVYGELYTSDAWLDVHEEVQRNAPDDGIENVVLPLMFWSDATHLASFGTASLWPLYMCFGGYSKYTRAKPTSGTLQHLAYIPKVRYFVHY